MVFFVGVPRCHHGEFFLRLQIVACHTPAGHILPGETAKQYKH